MNQTLINNYSENETNRVQYNVFSETDLANYFTTDTSLVDSAIAIVKDRLILIEAHFELGYTTEKCD